jgi:hypothetical protein
MTENIITWNATNWITITLMAAGGLAVAGAVLAMIASTGQGE